MEMILTTKEECILHIAQTNPSIPALRFGEEAWSYSNLWQRVLGLAIKIGEMAEDEKAIGVYMGMEPEFFTAVHATWLSGHNVILLNPDWTDFETRTVIVQGNVGIILYALFTPSPDFTDVPQYHTSDLYGPQGSSETQTQGSSPRSLRTGSSLRSAFDEEFLVDGGSGNLVQVGDEFWVSAPIVDGLETVLYEFDSPEQPINPDGPTLDISTPSDTTDFMPDHVSEVAISIAEQVSTLSKSARPISLDMPLDISHLDEEDITRLYHWLRTCYDWEGSLERLFEKDITPESLAYEIISVWEYDNHPGLQGYTWAMEDSSSEEVSAIQEVDLGDGVWEDCDGSSSKASPAPASAPSPEQELPRICISPVVEDPPCTLETSGQKHSHRDSKRGVPALHLDLSPKTMFPRSRDLLDVPSPSAIFSPPPGSSKKGVDDLDIGMAPYEVWSGKKAGLIVGLLALGSLMSPPPVPHPSPISFGKSVNDVTVPSTLRTRRDLPPLSLSLDSPSLAFPDAPYIDIYSSTPAESSSQDIGSAKLSSTLSGLLSVSSSVASLLSPWLEVVRFHGVEPVQSPWVADRCADLPSSSCLAGGFDCCRVDSGEGGRFPRSAF